MVAVAVVVVVVVAWGGVGADGLAVGGVSHGPAEEPSDELSHGTG